MYLINSNTLIKLTHKPFKNVAFICLTATSFILSGCGSDSDDTPTAVIIDPVVVSYDIRVINLTNSQPMSPITVVLHNEGSLWNVGDMASPALEVLAESGDSTDLLALDLVLASAVGAGVLMPGMSETIMVESVLLVPTHLSLATMLVNTNDAFTGINAMSLANLGVGESISLVTSSYDAGTENNSELMSTIPGPAAGGEGFNADRDDVDFVATHAGVVTADDGLNQSVLNHQHKFDNPTLRITVTRTE